MVDISNRSNPELLGSYDTDGEVWGVTVVGDLAYVADQDYGLVILDVSNRSDPHKVGEYQTNEFTRGVAVDGNYCYLAEGDAGLLILNITDSKAPVEVSRCETAGYSWSLVCSGDYVFMDKVVVNVADKANPRIVADYNLGDGIDIAVDRDHAYLARRSKGLTVLQLGPVAHIDGIWPAVAYQGQDVLFQGRGSASGIIHEYQWHSDIDGFFGQGDNFSISTFSTGSHNITLKVRDQWGQWSLEAAGSLLIHQRPVAYMDPVSPNLALTQKPLQFRAYALDDGYIQQYVWTSSLDGELHNNSFSNFSSSHLSQGTHTITFKAQDNFGCWSFELADMVILTDRPLASILEMTAIPELGEKAFHFQGSGEDDGFIQRFVWESSLDGEFYNGSMNSLMSESLSPGHHTINFRVQDDHGFWSRNQTKTLTINWDTDRDGIINSQDAFPNDPAASVDKDGDGYPDSWNLGMSQGDSSTGLSLDAYPSDPYLWEDNIEESGTPAFMALALIMAFFLVACVKDRGYF